jgi:hypothetical protein
MKMFFSFFFPSLFLGRISYESSSLVTLFHKIESQKKKKEKKGKKEKKEKRKIDKKKKRKKEKRKKMMKPLA